MANLIKTPHPVTLEGQERLYVELRPGESLFSFLYRAMGAEQLDGEVWNVAVGGVEVRREDWHNCYPKDGQLIEVSGDLGRSALMMVAVIALTIWTGGMFAAVAAGAGIMGMGAVASYAVIAGIQIAGSLLINKVLGPKPPGSPDTSQGPEAFTLNSTSNQLRQHGAVGLLFGRQRYAPDLLGKSYSYFDRDDMYLAMHLCWGIGVGRVTAIRNGDTLLTDYDDAAKEWHRGFALMPQQEIPLFGNADTQPGGSLQQEKELLTVARTTSVNTVRIMFNVSGTLYGMTRKGKLVGNQEYFDVSWRPVAGTTGSVGTTSRLINNDDRRTNRFTIAVDVQPGQYDVTIRRRGVHQKGDGDQCSFSCDTIVSVQEDHSPYNGVAHTGITLRANERLSGQPTEINGEAIAAPIPVWYADRGWVTEETSNPGAQMLKFLRGYYDFEGRLVAGMGAEDDEIDIEAFKAFMIHCRENSFEYNFWLAKDRDHLEVLNSIAGVAMGQFTDSGGLYSVAWVAEDQPVDGTINMARMKKGTFRVDYSLTATADGVVARYWDAEKNAEAILRVPMPGVQTMLSPATITLEGVTNEAQAALLARYFLAQSLYQFKDVSFGVSLENLTFRRLSLLQVSHDMTQWGYSGVVVQAVSEGASVKLYLDEPVPAPALGKRAYIGVRVPGQRAATVFKIKSFTGETRVVELDEVWPADLPLPGNSNGNPAHDSIWIYDFKETPGLTARVVNLQRAVDRSATVSVVQESAQFWTYVKTGFYEPADSGSLLNTRPTLSQLQVAEQQQVIGDVVQDQLVVSFEVSGPYDETRIYTAEPDGSLRERVRTNSRSATFNIPGPGTYTITAMPYNAQGLRGTGQSVTFSTREAGMPPVLVDYFDVTAVSAGVRFYNWGFHPDTIQSADFLGCEVRYLPGTEIDADWDTMIPVGETGYHTIPFEAVVPARGTYVFACRSRSAGGLLSEEAFRIIRTLGNDLGENLEQIREDNQQSFTELMEEVKKNQDAIIAETEARVEAVNNETEERKADIGRVEAGIAKNATDLLNEQLTREAEIREEREARQSEDASLAYQISQVTAGTGEQFDTVLGTPWHFSTDAEGWTAPGGVEVSAGFMRPLNPPNVSSGSTATSPVIEFDSRAYRHVMARIRRHGEPAWVGSLTYHFTDGTSGSLQVPEPAWDSSDTATVRFEDIPWSEDASKTVDSITLKLTALQDIAGGMFVEFDWVAIGRPAPGASVALVQEETRARIAGDVAEATKRETLAVQMRGDYDGDDASSPSLQSGLIHSEKTLRIAGDEALGVRIDSMRVLVDENKAAITEEARVRADEDAALALRQEQLSAQLGDKADATALQSLEVKVEENAEGIRSQAQSIQRLDSQLIGPHSGDTDEYAGDTDTYAGTLTVYTAITDATGATAELVERLNAQFGVFQGEVNQQLQVIATEQSAQATSIQQLRVQMGDKADAQAVQTLQARVGTVEGRTQVNAEAITRVEGSVAGKADGAVVQQMQVTINEQAGKVAQIDARYFLGVEANGLIGGMYIGNNGNRVATRFSTDVFTVESPRGGERLEWKNGAIRIYDGNNTMRMFMGIG
ncbi:putative tail component protein [Stenotrophomonas phage BUCT603]|nr:putative tail component protein [Stenotrophomonas phage BUCT603]